MMRLTLGIGIICFFMCTIAADLNNLINSGDDSTKYECVTTECHIDRLRASLSILLYMNESVSPCDNFYEFVCGNYEQVSNIDDNKPFTMTQKSSIQIVNKNLYNSIKKINATTEKLRPRKLVKEFFDMCMDTETREYRGTKSLMEIIKKLHGWPLVEGDTWNESNWRWENVYNEAIKLGVPTQSFLLNVLPLKFGEKGHKPLELRGPQTEFNAKRLTNPIRQDRAMVGYYDFMMNVTLKGFKIPPSIAIPQLLEVSNFETYLAYALSTSDWINGNITSLREDWGNIDWDTVFNMSAYGIEIDNVNEPVFLRQTEYLDYINFYPGPKRALANYQIWKFIEYAASFLNSEFLQMKKDYVKARYDVDMSVYDDWDICIRTVRGLLPHITDAIFIRDYFNKDVKTEVMEIIDNIQHQFMETLNSISWLDKSSREWIMAKINATKYLVAYPKEVYDDKKLDELYKDYEIVDGDFLKTVLRFNHLSQKRIMNHYKTYNRTGYEELSPWIFVNASNFQLENTLFVSAGILQDDRYNKNRPKYVNYGTIGMTIAHELSHSFDPNGVRFDKDGNYNGYDGFFNKTVQTMYNDKKDCLIDHYSKYKYPKIGVPINSRFTVNENMADVNGVRLAYHAYQQWVKNHGPEPDLPFVNFTTNQMYWISFAHAHCTNFKVQQLIEFSYDEHPVSDVRVMGSVSNSPEFAADFNCPINSKMNPINKCIFS